MKLTYTEGCICTSLDVGNKEFNIDLTETERREICHKIVDNCNDWLLQKIFCTYLESEGKEQDLGHCDCCGDHIHRYIIKLKE